MGTNNISRGRMIILSRRRRESSSSSLIVLSTRSSQVRSGMPGHGRDQTSTGVHRRPANRMSLVRLPVLGVTHARSNPWRLRRLLIRLPRSRMGRDDGVWSALRVTSSDASSWWRVPPQLGQRPSDRVILLCHARRRPDRTRTRGRRSVLTESRSRSTENRGRSCWLLIGRWRGIDRSW